MVRHWLGKVNRRVRQSVRPDPVTSGGPVRRHPTDAEARALASSLRLRILRTCLDNPQTNAQVAARLGRGRRRRCTTFGPWPGPGSSRRCPREGASRVPPRAVPGDREVVADRNPRSGRPDDGGVRGLGRDPEREDLDVARVGLRGRAGACGAGLPVGSADAGVRRPPADPGGRPWSVFVAVHPDPTGTEPPRTQPTARAKPLLINPLGTLPARIRGPTWLINIIQGRTAGWPDSAKGWADG